MPSKAPRARKLGKGSALLTKYLEDHEMTIYQFAEAVACSKSYIGMLKNGDVTPGLSLATRIEKLAGIPCSAWAC